jgi:uncharacterized protein YndB with AHSA1/START domain
MTLKPSPAAPRRFSMERTYGASLDEVWSLWTTKDGIESWWGPEGFEVKVRSIDLRPKGELNYAMIATGPAEIEFMTKAGMPLTTEAKITYTEIQPQRRLGYTTLTDFIPGVDPYDVATLVELHEEAGGVRMVLTFDAMHDDLWSEQARAGHESQLRKLDAVLAARGRGVRP